MPSDLKIRPIGRPQIGEDSALGYRKLTRRYAVEGPRVAKDQIGDRQIHASSDLFRKVGEVDEEFDDFFLVNQQVEPSASVDKAHLSRTYVQFRNSWFGESISENRDLRRLSRRYMVLKQEESELPAKAQGLGYPSASWLRHPSSSNFDPMGNSTEPWDMKPSMIQRPDPLSDGVLNAAANHPYGSATATLESLLLSSQYTQSSKLWSWVEGSAQVDTSNPGFDVWNVSWVAPSAGYWASGSAAGGGDNPIVVYFSQDGLKIRPVASGSLKTVANFTFFYVGPVLPQALAGFGGNSIPYVSFDLKMLSGREGSGGITRVFKNAVFDYANNTKATMAWDGHQVAAKSGYGYGSGDLIFNFDAGPPVLGTGTVPQWTKTVRYQGREMTTVAGIISWSHLYHENTAGSNLIRTAVSPVHSYRGNHIWRISLTYG